jgi:dGTPase
MPLAPYAAHEAGSRGRVHAEPSPAPYRSEYQRDRDRIIHSTAFRRLEYKTQVFVNHEGDLFRTRLTHSLEVAQITRSIARSLELNEDLAEAIALAHDLGHTPFGHAGQDALDECMKAHGGFEHNLQSLRVVDKLEQRYPGFDGLNLCFETREGILKHCPPDKARLLGEVGERFVRGGQPSLEAQLANLADSIAYNSHDVDDGLRAGLLSLEQLRDQPFFGEHYQAAASRWPETPPRRLRYETVRRMINAQVLDLIETSRQRLQAARPADSQAVRGQPRPLIAFSAAMAEQHRNLKRFLHEQLYRHHQVYRMSAKAKQVVRRLFAAYGEDLGLLPPDTRRAIEQRPGGEAAARARGVADYIAGMTDRFALLEYRKLFDPNFFAAQSHW